MTTYINEYGDTVNIQFVIESASIFGPYAIEVEVVKPTGSKLNYWVLDRTHDYGIYPYNTAKYGITGELYMWLARYASGLKGQTLSAWIDAFKLDIYVF